MRKSTKSLDDRGVPDGVVVSAPEHRLHGVRCGGCFGLVRKRVEGKDSSALYLALLSVHHRHEKRVPLHKRERAV